MEHKENGEIVKVDSLQKVEMDDDGASEKSRNKGPFYEQTLERYLPKIDTLKRFAWHGEEASSRTAEQRNPSRPLNPQPVEDDQDDRAFEAINIPEPDDDVPWEDYGVQEAVDAFSYDPPLAEEELPLKAAPALPQHENQDLIDPTKNEDHHVTKSLTQAENSPVNETHPPSETKLEAETRSVSTQAQDFIKAKAAQASPELQQVMVRTISLHVRIPTSGDEDRDWKKVKMVQGAIMAHPGDCFYYLSICEKDTDVELGFPNEMVEISDTLIKKLGSMVGPENVKIVILEEKADL